MPGRGLSNPDVATLTLLLRETEQVRGNRSRHGEMDAEQVTGINSGDPAPTGQTGPEQRAYNTLSTFFGRNAAYGAMMVTRPQTIGYALTDSHSGLAAFTCEQIAEWSDSDGHPKRVIGRDEILDDITP